MIRPTHTEPTTSRHVLIEGAFSAADAREVLLSLLTFKVDFHKRRNFSSMERTGQPDRASERRIEQLRTTLDDVSAALSEAIAADLPVHVRSTIRLTVGDRPEGGAK